MAQPGTCGPTGCFLNQTAPPLQLDPGCFHLRSSGLLVTGQHRPCPACINTFRVPILLGALNPSPCEGLSVWGLWEETEGRSWEPQAVVEGLIQALDTAWFSVPSGIY